MPKRGVLRALTMAWHEGLKGRGSRPLCLNHDQTLGERNRSREDLQGPEWYYL